ncbi:DUF4221 family protein [Cyclobacterium sp.]|uniref:DUF4221 family protein n=1 Tax=Cyclobacterium sp. TaxID=1966343 RepID=UPI0019B38851|nr:DUF4221 family protein [Cyclobacterium sp.]MBD3628595.1 DUF4221 family protein [Cyclobacterium sp.]
MKYLDQGYQNLKICREHLKLLCLSYSLKGMGGRLFLISLLFTLVFCQGKKASEGASAAGQKSNLLENFTFSMDTLMVDTGDQLINFGIPFIGAVSPNGLHYHILDYKTLELQRIHLDSLKLVDSYFFEKDGPNSPGFTFPFQPLGEGLFFFPAFGKPSIIRNSGIKVRSWNLNQEKIIEGFPVESATVNNRIVFDANLDQLYSLPFNYETRHYYLAVLDSTGERKVMVPLPEFQKAHLFTIRTGGPEGGGLKIELPFLQHFNDRVLISCTVGNGIYVYESRSDSLFYRRFPLKLVPPKKTGEVKNQVLSQQEFERELEKLSTQISYWNFIRDEKSGRYFRFASRVLSPETESTAAKLEIFLMAYSEDLELIGETKIKGLSTLPKGGFFKDGKLWSHVNVADELGFAVMDLKF